MDSQRLSAGVKVCGSDRHWVCLPLSARRAAWKRFFSMCVIAPAVVHKRTAFHARLHVETDASSCVAATCTVAQGLWRTKFFDILLCHILQVARHGIPACDSQPACVRISLNTCNTQKVCCRMPSINAHASDSDHRISVVQQAKTLQVLGHFFSYPFGGAERRGRSKCVPECLLV